MSSTLVGVPFYTLAGYKGMGEAPKTLRRAGLSSALGGPADAGDVKIPSLKKDEPQGGAKNFTHFTSATDSIYRTLRSVRSERVFVVGGECSLTPGSLAGLGEVFGGSPGMLWMDAHGDFNVPETSPSGYIGGMCLAMACGKGPRLGEAIESRRPLLAEERLVHVGSRALDPPEIAAFNASPAKLFTTQQVKSAGAVDVGEEAARHLANRAEWVVCHLDVDVVDPSLIPAVNYPTPGGLTSEETATIIRALARTGKLKAFELASYNSSKDKGGSSAKSIVDLVRSIFG